MIGQYLVHAGEETEEPVAEVSPGQLPPELGSNLPHECFVQHQPGTELAPVKIW